jgi:glycerol-3-phosphate dehydrogenase (NAD(P)+)
VTRCCVVGGGSWGTALAGVLARNGHETVLWAREADVVAEVNERHTNQGFLPDVPLPEALRAEGDLAAALSGAGVVVSVVPAQFAGGVWDEAAGALEEEAVVVSATKGIELATLRRMDQVLGAYLGPRQRERFTVLSGPSFAAEVARLQPTAVVAAGADEAAARTVQSLFQNRHLRVYTNPDVVGVELGGALKNVMALAAGVAVGLGFGHNTMAALVTRGLAEMTRLGVAMGARRETFAGLAGMGDLVLTCTGDLSRNRTVGVRLGRGEALDDILGEMRAVAEGVKTAEAVVRLAGRHGVEMPIAQEVHAMLVEGRAPRTALDNLMSRDPKPEEWS